MAKLTPSQVAERAVPNQQVIICHATEKNGAYGVIYKDELKIACKLLYKSAPALVIYMALATNQDGYALTSGAHSYKEYGLNRSGYQRGKEILKALGFLTPDSTRSNHWHFWHVPNRYESIRIADDTPCIADDTPCIADDTPCIADDTENNTRDNTRDITRNNNIGVRSREEIISHYKSLIDSTLPEDEHEREKVLSILEKYKTEHRAIAKSIDTFGAWIDGWNETAQQPNIILSFYPLPEAVIKKRRHDITGIPENYYASDPEPERSISEIISDLSLAMGWYDIQNKYSEKKKGYSSYDFESNEQDEYEPDPLDDWDGSLPF